MKAMILAAGRGTRVRPITNSIPKPMIPLVRKPVLESIVEHLSRYGIDEIVINTSHLATEIEDYFRDGESLGVNIAYSFEGVMRDGSICSEALGSAGGMRKVQDFSGFFDETFVVLCGDALIDLDVSQVLKFHRESGSIATIALKEVPRAEVHKYGVVETDPLGRIKRFQEKPRADEAVSNLANTGIYIFEPEIFKYIPSGTEYDIGGDLFPDLVKAGLPFFGISLPFQWLDIGSTADYWKANRTVLTGGFRGYTLPGREVRPGVRVGVNVNIDLDAVTIEGPVYIGSGSSIGEGATIVGPTVIGANSVVESGAVVRECLVHDYTRVSGVARLTDKIVLGGYCIDPYGGFIDIAKADIGWLVQDARKEFNLSGSHRVLFDLALAS